MKLSRALIVLVLLAPGGCATWQTPVDADYAALRARAISDSVRGVTLSASVLGAADSRQLLGADINTTGVQPVWIEVRNNSADTLWLLRSGTDPDYFSPLEIAWPLHSRFAKKTNASIDDYFDNAGFHNPIPPGTTGSGILFTNPHRGTHVLNVDLLGQQTIFPFTLFLPIPGEFTPQFDENLARLAATDNTTYQDLDSLRRALEKLPCCASNDDPINLIFVGNVSDIAAATIRRGYRRYSGNDSDVRQLLFGRQPDIVMRKQGEGVANNWLHMWIAPLRYLDNPVVLVQAGRPPGGRNSKTGIRTQQLHPDVDEARDLLIQDLLYSGGLAQLGYIGGIDAIPETPAADTNAGMHYYTDGLRAVLFFVTRPRTLSEIDILDWVPLLQQRESATTAQDKPE